MVLINLGKCSTWRIDSPLLFFFFSVSNKIKAFIIFVIKTDLIIEQEEMLHHV